MLRKTAIANYETASNNEEQAYRQVVSDTRMDYLGVLSQHQHSDCAAASR